MSILLDAFDDAGLLDRETRAFLVEALENAEPDDWRDILEPFVAPPEPALEALLKEPGVLARSRRALEKEEEVRQEDEVSPLAEAFLKALPSGILALSGLHTVVRVARVCRAARAAALEGDLWRRRAEAAAVRWGLAGAARLPEGEVGTWRERYFAVLRPRCDGIYVGECGFKRWIRLGHHMDLRKNAEALACFGGRGGTGERVKYYRYVRLLPPDSADRSLWALVLQDPCPREVAEKVLTAGVDVRAHANPAKSEGGLSEGAVASATDAQRLRKRICVGRYTFAPEEGRVDVRYTAADGEYRLTFALAHHAGRPGLGDRLTWEHYEMAEGVDGGGEVIEFNLGRLPDWKGGGLSDENKDHFPQMKFRPKVALEHLL